MSIPLNQAGNTLSLMIDAAGTTLLIVIVAAILYNIWRNDSK